MSTAPRQQTLKATRMSIRRCHTRHLSTCFTPEDPDRGEFTSKWDVFFSASSQRLLVISAFWDSSSQSCDLTSFIYISFLCCFSPILRGSKISCMQADPTNHFAEQWTHTRPDPSLKKDTQAHTHTQREREGERERESDRGKKCLRSAFSSPLCLVWMLAALLFWIQGKWQVNNPIITSNDNFAGEEGFRGPILTSGGEIFLRKCTKDWPRMFHLVNTSPRILLNILCNAMHTVLSASTA